MQFSDDEMKKVLTEVAHNISLERKGGEYQWQVWQSEPICP